MSDTLKTSELAVEAAAAIRATKPQGAFTDDSPRHVLNEDSVHHEIVRDFENACWSVINRCNTLRQVRESMEKRLKK